jgi:hypothetical protein
MKKAALIATVALFLLIAPLSLVSAEASEMDSDWNRRIASPSYGFSFGFAEVKYGNDSKATVVMPGIDLRHFNGTNVTEAGGFYYGYELGVAANFYLGSETLSNGASEYDIEQIAMATLFLMGKHGYRIELPGTRGKFGIGLELGMGLMGGAGSFELKEKGGDNLSQTEEIIGPVFEAGIEGLMDAGPNNRLVLRLGLMVSPEVLDAEVYGFNAEAAPVRINIRCGFVRDH